MSFDLEKNLQLGICANKPQNNAGINLLQQGVFWYNQLLRKNVLTINWRCGK